MSREVVKDYHQRLVLGFGHHWVGLDLLTQLLNEVYDIIPVRAAGLAEDSLSRWRP